MSNSSGFSGFTQSPAGKAVIGLVVVAAIAILGFEFTHMNSGEESRVVQPKQAISEAQQQIDAINKMTNLSPEQKKQMIAHEQGEIATAQGSMGGSQSSPSGPGQAPPGSN